MREDDGVATVFVCIIAVTLVAVTVVALQIGAATVARHRAEVAADAGALAGALLVLDGAEAACSAADRVVRANGAELTSCALDGADVMVEVQTSVTIGPLRRAAPARARAGPVADQAR